MSILMRSCLVRYFLNSVLENDEVICSGAVIMKIENMALKVNV